MFRLCGHDQPIGTNCIDCIMEAGEKRRLYYHITHADDPEEEIPGILESTRDVKEKFGKDIATLANVYFEKGDNFRLILVSGLVKTVISSEPI